ncbi:hypothetical protein E2C01_008634 [Portunus trituberculatus]|uniref:Uncharacterized protein n=1 Tax=Portunus trituberculatus TaxID=210409 RepID=A0A5B7D3M7_PORTR|nr:hypothetical protein [Portunus trituberculatus]
MTLTLPRPDVTAPAYITLLFLTTAGLPCFNLGGDGDFSTCTTLPKTFDGRADASLLAKVLGSWEECEGKEPGVDGEVGDSPSSSPRHRR